MRLVTSMLTITELSNIQIKSAVSIIRRKFDAESKIYRYGTYPGERDFYNVDVDLFDVDFSDDLYGNIRKLISAYEEILRTFKVYMDIIASNDDTEGEIQIYSKDKNDVGNFGLFVTKRQIPNVQPYYSSDVCNAYVNLTHVSFGVYL